MCQAKNFRQETKFLSEKMGEKSRFCELSTDEVHKLLENVISPATKKATDFGLNLNGTYFLTNVKKF